jgi:hypothetical protein
MYFQDKLARLDPGKNEALDLGDAKAKLEMVRKGCCHPQLLDTTLRGQHQQNSGARPLDLIMVNKVEQAKNLCQDRQRDVLFYAFKAAGLVLLHAQCCVDESLYLFENKHKMEYLLNAYALYCVAWHCIQSNRGQSCLTGLAKVSTTKALSANDPTVSVLNELQLTWTSPIHNIRADGNEQSCDKLPRYQSPTIWAVLDVSTVPSLFKSLQDIVYSGVADETNFVKDASLINFCKSVLRFSHLKSIGHISMAVDFDQISRNLMCNDASDNQLRYYLLLLPRCMELKSAGVHGVLKEVCSFLIEFSSLLSDERLVCIAPEKDALRACMNPRSKSWQLQVTSFYAKSLLLRCDGKQISCSLFETDQWRSLLSWGESTEITCIVKVGMSESSIDVDSLQVS